MENVIHKETPSNYNSRKFQVKATDSDSGANAEIEYHVSDDNFAVDSNGVVNNHKTLDADNNNAYYEFVITAKDKGKIYLSK